MKTDSNKEKAVDLAVTQIERQYGKGSIMKLGAEAMLGEVPVLATGSLSLDLALGVGGLPRGRVVEIYGPEASGKTTLALHIVAEAQKKGGIAGFIDAEHALDVAYAQKLGVKTDELLNGLHPQLETGQDHAAVARAGAPAHCLRLQDGHPGSLHRQGPCGAQAGITSA